MVGYGIIDQSSSKAPARAFNPIYALFIVIAVSVYYWTAVSEKAGLSALLTLSAIWQCSAFSLLVVGVLITGSVKGISAKSMQLQAAAFACRLSSTTWLSGYIPFDRTGDFLYEGFDMLSLVMVLWLLYRIIQTQQEIVDDDLPLSAFIVGALVLAALFHADLDERPIFDTLWMFALFIGALAMLPQVRLTVHNAAGVPAGMNHFVAAMTISCILRGTFFWFAFYDFTSKSWFTSMIQFNLCGHAAMTAHAVQLLLMAGVMCSELKNFATKGHHAEQGPFLQHEV